MAKFTYIGTTKEGERVTQVVEAADRYAVYAIARDNGHSIVSVSEANKFSFRTLLKVEKIDYLLSKVKQDELVMTTRNLSSMLNAGLTLTRALSVIERQTKNPRLKGVMKSIQESINKGDPFYTALKEFPETFSPLYISMVRAGEESGSLVDTLKTISIQLERSSTLRKKIKGAMMYPAIVIGIMLILGVLMMIYVVPTLTSTFTKLNIELPLSTRIIIGASDTLSNHSLLVLGGFATLIALFVFFLRSRIGKKVADFFLIHAPIVGPIVKQTNSAYTARTLSSLLSAGVDVIHAIKITEDVLQNSYYKNVLGEAAMKVEKGAPLSEAFIAHQEVYPILVGEMILVGEETGQISHMLGELATFYETEVEQKTKDLSTIIEPLLMVVIGGGVGFFALAMIGPIYSISEGIG